VVALVVLTIVIAVFASGREPPRAAESPAADRKASPELVRAAN
jgi:hypothetical protein